MIKSKRWLVLWAKNGSVWGAFVKSSLRAFFVKSSSAKPPKTLKISSLHRRTLSSSYFGNIPPRYKRRAKTSLDIISALWDPTWDWIWLQTQLDWDTSCGRLSKVSWGQGSRVSWAWVTLKGLTCQGFLGLVLETNCHCFNGKFCSLNNIVKFSTRAWSI